MKSALEGVGHLERELSPEPFAAPAIGALALHGALLAALVAYAATAAAAHFLPPVSTYRRDIFTIAAASDHPVPVLGAVGPAFRVRLVVVAGLAFAISFVTGPANTFVFLFAQNVVHLAGGIVAAMVVGAGVTGLAGLLAGRWLSDHVGRRPTGALGLVGIIVFGTLTYAGAPAALIVGYLLSVFAGSVFAPASARPPPIAEPSILAMVGRSIAINARRQVSIASRYPRAASASR